MSTNPKPNDTLYVDRGDGQGEQRVTNIETSEGTVRNIYLKKPEWNNERLVWTSEEPDPLTAYAYRWDANDLRYDLGDRINEWPEQVASYNATQATSSYQPRYTPDGIGGNPSVWHEPNEFLEAGAFPDGVVDQPFTIVLVAEYENQNDHSYAFYGSDTRGDRTFLNMDRDGDATFWAGTAGGIQLPKSSDPHVFVLVADGTDSVLQIDHVQTTGDAGTLGMNGITLGGRPDALRGFYGHLAEFRFYNWRLDEADRGEVVDDRRSDWNISTPEYSQ